MDYKRNEQGLGCLNRVAGNVGQLGTLDTSSSTCLAIVCLKQDVAFNTMLLYQMNGCCIRIVK